jgi:hypothetical protein
MSSLPFDVHEVLEQEYVSMYGPLDGVPPPEYAPSDIVDEPWARKILSDCQFTESTVLATLNGFISSAKPGETVPAATTLTAVQLKKLARSPAITANGRDLIKRYAGYTAGDTTKHREINRRIVDDVFHGAVKPLRDIRLAALYEKIHRREADTKDARTALCISGGGIRTATFGLGVIQGLAAGNILDKFHYLSTVSGGGYIGSWLSSWARRHPKGMSGVQEDLVCADTAFEGTLTVPQKLLIAQAPPPPAPAPALAMRKAALPKSKIDPEPRPIRHLRDYSNYLSPRLGVTSADTWTMAALYIRNLLLNLLILVPILALLLAIPRMFSWMLQNGAAGSPAQPLFWMNVCLAIAFGYIGLARPVAPGHKDQWTRLSRAGLYNGLTILPLTAAAMFLATYWARHAATSGIFGGDDVILFFGPNGLIDADWGLATVGQITIGVTTLHYTLMAMALMTLWPCIIYYVRYLTSPAASRKAGLSRQGGKHFAKKLGFEFAGAFFGVVTALGLTVLAALKLFPEPLHPVGDPSAIETFLRPLTDSMGQSHIYLCFAVPLMLLIFFVQASIFVGLSSRRNEDDDREWWGRAGAYLLFFAAAVALLSVITVFGPLILFRAPLILASVGGLSGIAAALFGFSAKTPANGKEKEDTGTSGKLMNAAGGVIVPIFACILLAAISLGHSWLAEQFNGHKVKDIDVAFASQFEGQASTSTIVPVDRDVTSGSLTRATTPAVPDGKVRTNYVVKRESPKTAEDSLVDARSIAHLKTIADTSGVQIVIVVLVFGLAFGLSFFIGVNKFSMHSLYRNRLIRAYLGASRYTRDPDAFTGFDPHDNLQMHELRQELLWPTSFTNAEKIADDLKVHAQPVLVYLWGNLDKETQQQLAKRKLTDAVEPELCAALARDLNALLLSGTFGGALPTDSAAARLRANRLKLDEVFAGSIRPFKRGPMHVINTALNLTAGEKLAWQQRQAESFTITPLHSGSFYVGYRDSKEYGGPDGISVGTAVTISGAAASPNQGYNSSPALAFLLTLLNVRLGSWLGNPGLAGRKSFNRNHPRTNLEPLLWELTGTTNDQCPLVYLSDGGHFENLGLYEMVLRRCRYIVVSDGGCDPKYTFEDLGNAIRKIRTDLGVPIDIEKMFMFPRTPDGKYEEGRYVATARIRYSAIDETPKGLEETGIDGTLIYIKPGLYSEEYFPKDVYNYATSSAEFPHESTADQFFSESQFESYRALGRHAINEICGNYAANNGVFPVATSFESVAEFAKHVAGKAGRDESHDIQIDRKNTPNLPVAIALTATPNARLVIR